MSNSKYLQRKRNRYKNNHNPYMADCVRIQKVAAENGLEITPAEAREIWEDYSEMYFCAGWLILPRTDRELWKEIERIENRGEQVSL